MRMSTIAKHLTGGEGSTFARALGREIKERRIALGMSQTAAGRPLSRAFLSSVERGRLTPSLPSLLIIARRLNTSAGTILGSVERKLEATDDDGDPDEAGIAR